MAAGTTQAGLKRLTTPSVPMEELAKPSFSDDQVRCRVFDAQQFFCGIVWLKDLPDPSQQQPHSHQPEDKPLANNDGFHVSVLAQSLLDEDGENGENQHDRKYDYCVHPMAPWFEIELRSRCWNSQ